MCSVPYVLSTSQPKTNIPAFISSTFIPLGKINCYFFRSASNKFEAKLETVKDNYIFRSRKNNIFHRYNFIFKFSFQYYQ